MIINGSGERFIVEKLEDGVSAKRDEGTIRVGVRISARSRRRRGVRFDN